MFHCFRGQARSHRDSVMSVGVGLPLKMLRCHRNGTAGRRLLSVDHQNTHPNTLMFCLSI